MRRLSIRRGPSISSQIGLSLTGLGLGFLTGFLARGLIGPGRALVERPGPGTRTRVRGSARALAGRIREALDTDPETRTLELDVVPVAGRRLEIHGWVTSRRLGSHALRLAGDAAPEAELTNRLRVRGEDDTGPGSGAATSRA